MSRCFSVFKLWGNGMGRGKKKGGESFGISATTALVMAQIFAVASIALIFVFVFHFRGGFSLAGGNGDRLFNAHQVLMLLGPVIFGGQAIMAFKMVPGPRIVKKIVHLLLSLVGMVFGALGLYAILKVFKEYGKVPNLHSFHSWTGMGVIGLYIIECLQGLIILLFRGMKKARSGMKSWHAFFGLLGFILAIFTSGTGLVQRFRFLSLTKGGEACVLNFTGISIILFGICVFLSTILP